MIREPVWSRIARLISRHRQAPRVVHFNIYHWGFVLQLDLLGQHRRDLVVLPLVHRRDGQQEDEHLASVGSRPESGRHAVDISDVGGGEV